MTTRVVNGGELKPHKGVNLPGAKLKIPALTRKDRADLAFAVAHHVDYIALSFVRSADNIIELKKSMRANIPVIAKIEKPEAVEDFDSILRASEGVMVARGDLCGETQPEQVPLYQKMIIRKFVGAFLIYNAFAMTAVERTREFGMLRTIGMTRGQVTGLVFLEAGVLGILGSLAGVGVGMLLARGLTQLMGVILNQPLAMVNAPASDMLSSWAIGVFVTFLAAGMPAWQAGRISPMEALRVRGKSTEGWLIREGWKLGVVLLIISTIILIVNPFPYEVQFRLGSMTVFGLRSKKPGGPYC